VVSSFDADSRLVLRIPANRLRLSGVSRRKEAS
jgi:hypothetical protein